MKGMIMVFLMIVLLAGGFGHTQLNAKAAAAAPAEATRYYTSIYINEGESLWSIAARYRQNSRLTTTEYIDELKQMNGLVDEVIHAGQYLTIVYFE